MFARARRSTLLCAAVLGLIASANAAPMAEPFGVSPPSQAPIAAKLLGLKQCRLIPVTSSISPAGILQASETATLEFELSPGVRTFFTLEPYSVRAPDFKLIISDETGDHEVPAPRPTTYRGTSAAGDEVWASIYNDQVNAVIAPAANPFNRLYIQPSGLDGPDAPHAIYAADDVIPTDHTCGVGDCVNCGASTTPRPGMGLRGAAACRYFKVAVDCDYPMYQQNAFDVGATVRSVESVMLGVNQIYVANALNANPRFTMSHLAVRTTNASDPYNSVPLLGGTANALLNLVAPAWTSVPTSARTFIHLFTGRDTSGSTIGLAFVGAMCTSSATGFSETNFSTNLPSRINVTTHELGHNFGMNHDAGGAPFIMAPVIANPPNETFSAASIATFNNFLTAQPTCGSTAFNDVQPDGASTIKNRAIRIDVLANDGRSTVACPTAVTTFTLPASTTTLGGSVAISTGTGPGGRNEVLYTPPANIEGQTDSFNYTALSTNIPVIIDIQVPRAPEGTVGQDPGLTAVYYNTWPNGNMNSWWIWETPPTDLLTAYATFGTPQTLPQLNYTTLLPGGFARGLSASITGYVRIPTSDYWTFTLAAGSSARLFLGNDAFLAAGNSAAGAEVSATRAMTAGLHAFRVDYHWGPNPGPKLILSYASSTQPKVVIPTTALFRNLGTAPACPADFNGVGGLTVNDIFDFLNAWFAGNPAANFNGVNGVTINDIFDFLNAWFAGCP